MRVNSVATIAPGPAEAADPERTYDQGSIATSAEGRWFVPLNFMVGKLITPRVVTSVEVGVPIVDDYRVYDFKIELRAGFFF